jgi:hypothetical protein
MIRKDCSTLEWLNYQVHATVMQVMLPDVRLGSSNPTYFFHAFPLVGGSPRAVSNGNSSTSISQHGCTKTLIRFGCAVAQRQALALLGNGYTKTYVFVRFVLTLSQLWRMVSA